MLLRASSIGPDARFKRVEFNFSWNLLPAFYRIPASAYEIGGVNMEERQLSEFLFESEDELKSYSDSFESRSRDSLVAFVK